MAAGAPVSPQGCCWAKAEPSTSQILLPELGSEAVPSGVQESRSDPNPQLVCVTTPSLQAPFFQTLSSFLHHFLSFAPLTPAACYQHGFQELKPSPSHGSGRAETLSLLHHAGDRAPGTRPRANSSEGRSRNFSYILCSRNLKLVLGFRASAQANSKGRVRGVKGQPPQLSQIPVLYAGK